MFKKIIGVVAICATLLLLQLNFPREERQVKIYINQLVEHPALDATTKGIIDGLADGGYINGSNMELKIESAQGNMALSGQIANKFISNKPDIVVGVATMAAQSFVKFAKAGKTKLIFTTVTDPLGANLVKNLEQPGNNTSGVSNFVALEPQIEMFKQIKPSIKKLGFLYNPGEFNSISLIEQLRLICRKYDIKLITISARKLQKSLRAQSG